MHNEVSLLFINTEGPFSNISIVGLVVEFVVAIDEARVRFTDDAFSFFLLFFSLRTTNQPIKWMHTLSE